jgi:hypothetical protein
MNKILLVTEGMQEGEHVKFGGALEKAGTLNGLTREQIKKAFDTGQIFREKLEGKEWSAVLSMPGNEEYTHILSVGSIASNKVGIQNMKNERVLLMIPNPRSWDEKMTAGTIESIAKFLKGFSVDKKAKTIKIDESFFRKPDEQEQKREAEIRNRPASVNINPAVAKEIDLQQFDAASLEAFLKLEVSNSRFQACIFNFNKDAKPTVQLINTNIARREPLDDFVPVLVGDNIIKDESKIKELQETLAKAGYKQTYLMPIYEFTKILYLYMGLAKDNKVTFELVV